MCVRVRNILEIDILQNYKILAGEGGLDNIVLSINIFEYILNKTHDRTGELYLTSFYGMKEHGDDPLFEHISILIDTNCPGLLLGNGVYDSVSDRIKKLADQNNFPIISIPENVIYSEVLQSAYNKILKKKPIQNNSVLLDRIMGLDDRVIINKYANKMNQHFKDYYAILYIQSESEPYHIYKALKREDIMINYKNDTIIVLTFDKPVSDIKNYIIELYKIDVSKNNGYNIGLSNACNDYHDFKNNVRDAKYACIVSKIIKDNSVETVSNIGIYKLLIAVSENDEAVEYSREIINKVKDYDEQYNLDILKTFLMYVNCDYDINKTSESLFLHKNTIRYRLKKIEIIIDNSNNDCMEQLATAVRILKLKNEL